MLESCGTHVINISDSQCLLMNGSGNASQVGGYMWGVGRRVTPTMVVELYVISLLILVGVVGNVISVIVLRKDRERRNALLLLQALAVADLLYLLVAAMRYPFKHLLPSYEIYVDMQPTVFPLLKTFQTITIWMMVLVTVDRWVCVCRSTEAPSMFNPRTRRRYATGVFIAGFIYNLPRYLDSHICSWYNPCTGQTISEMSYREVFASNYYWDIYIGAMYLLLLYIAPLSSLGYFNFRLIQAIRYSKKRYRMGSRLSSASTRTRTQWSTGLHHGGGQGGYAVAGSSSLVPPSSPTVTGSDKNATLVLVAIVAVFIICETPELVVKFVSFTERNFKYKLIYQIRQLNIVSELLMVVNSTVNFVVYLVFGRRFRRILREMFRFSFKFTSGSSTTTTDDTAARHHNCIHAPTARLHRI